MEAVLVAVKEVASRDKKLIAGTGAESTAETIERTKRAAELGYDAALVKTPPLAQYRESSANGLTRVGIV